MKPALHFFISVLFLFFTLYKGDLKANPDCITTLTSSECENSAENLLVSDAVTYCYPPDWQYTYNITQNSAYFQWNACNGASYYTVQWRYPNGSWNTIQEYCNQTWINCGNLQPCTSYEWRVQSHCGYGYSSNWCYPVYFTTLCDYCHPPDWLQCYDITGYSATWKWAGVYGADCYSVQWCTQGGSWNDLYGGPIYGTWCNVNFLNPCTTYQWRVRSYCHYSGWSNWCYPYTFNTVCENQCPVPSGLITKDIGDFKATFKWSPVYGASSYTVQIRSDHYGNWYDLPGSPTSGTWITASNLSSCHQYEWRVRANCSYYSSSYWSQPVPFSTSCGHGCFPPDWVYTNNISSSSASLHWAPVGGADYYVVEWRIPGGVWYEMQGGPWSNTWTDLNGLQPNTTYEWRVKSHCYSGYWSDFSSITYFTTIGSTCEMPLFRYTLPITDFTATFNWTAVSGAVNYTVQILINGQWQDVPGSPTSATSITATGLLPNTEYQWRMQVNCGNGAYSPWLSAIKFTTGTSNGCATPGSLYVDNLSLNSAVLHWSTVPNDSTYSVEIRVWPNGAWNPVSGSPVDTNFIVVDGLNPFTSYEWHVRGNCKGGYHSFWSGGVVFTTTNAPPCNTPVNLQSSLITETTVTFSWSHIAGAQGYQVQTRLPNGNWVDLLGLVPDTTVLATGFTPHTTYEWRVRTKCDSMQYSNWSAIAAFTTIGSGAPNDECSTAMLLTVENSCVSTFASNVDATASQPPPVGGCNSVNAKDVWFKFTMPDVPNPAVTIRTNAGSLGNAVMEVYSGAGCGVMSVIACEDNNENGNGSSMPVINLTGTANATIWVRVWGFEGSTGTFTICVFNYISFNYADIPDTNESEVGGTIEELENAIPVTMEPDAKPEIRISPNPVSDVLNVEVMQTKDSHVVGLRVMDLSGKIRFTQDVDPTQDHQFKSTVDVSTFVPGIYVLQVQTTSGMMAEKISVIK